MMITTYHVSNFELFNIPPIWMSAWKWYNELSTRAIQNINTTFVGIPNCNLQQRRRGLNSMREEHSCTRVVWIEREVRKYMWVHCKGFFHICCYHSVWIWIITLRITEAEKFRGALLRALIIFTYLHAFRMSGEQTLSTRKGINADWNKVIEIRVKTSN